MSDVINKTTMQLLRSVHTPDYQDGNWIIIDIAWKEKYSLPNCLPKYWKLNQAKTAVLEMTTLQKATVDSDLATVAKVSTDAAERERLIQERMHKNAEDELIAEEIIDAIE